MRMVSGVWRIAPMLGLMLLAPALSADGAAAQDKPQIEATPQISHASVVSSVAFSPDGVRLLSGSWDSTSSYGTPQRTLNDPPKAAEHAPSLERQGSAHELTCMLDQRPNAWGNGRWCSTLCSKIGVAGACPRHERKFPISPDRGDFVCPWLET